MVFQVTALTLVEFLARWDQPVITRGPGIHTVGVREHVGPGGLELKVPVLAQADAVAALGHEGGERFVGDVNFGGGNTDDII